MVLDRNKSCIELIALNVHPKNSTGNIGVREIFCQGGGGKPFAQKHLASCPNFYERVEKK